MKGYRRLVISKYGIQYKSAGQCSMTTKIYFSSGSEPSYIKVLALWNKENCLGQVIFHRQVLHKIFINPTFQRNDCGRVTREKFIGKGIYLIKCHFFFCKTKKYHTTGTGAD